jgi:hypothetical protein
MTDKFMSGWGNAKGRINKLIFICDTVDEAKIVFKNAGERSDMKFINICYKKPWYSPEKYYVQEKTKESYPSWYVVNYFRKDH